MESEQHYIAARDEWIAALMVASEFEKNLKSFEKTPAKDYVKKMKKMKVDKKPLKVKADAPGPIADEITPTVAQKIVAKEVATAKKSTAAAPVTKKSNVSRKTSARSSKASVK